MIECLVNGTLSEFVVANDRGFSYGDGLFETMVVEQGQPRFWQSHMDRLADGCKRLGLDIPPQELLLREVKTVSAGQSKVIVKIILTRGASGRGYAPGENPDPMRVVSSHAFPEIDDLRQLKGVEGRVCDLRLGIQPALGGIKHLNRLEQVLAAREMTPYPGVEGILLNHENYVISAISSNLFLVCDGQLLTPRMDRCGVRGVVRKLILRDFKARSELRRVTVDFMHEAEEVFLCNAVRGIVPLVSLGDHSWPVGVVTRELQEWFKRRSAVV